MPIEAYLAPPPKTVTRCKKLIKCDENGRQVMNGDIAAEGRGEGVRRGGGGRGGRGEARPSLLLSKYCGFTTYSQKQS